MGKQSRLRKERKQHPELLNVEGKVTPQMRKAADAYFSEMSGNLEVLTEELIAELVAKGWEEQPLREAQAMGLKYSRKRNSLWE